MLSKFWIFLALALPLAAQSTYNIDQFGCNHANPSSTVLPGSVQATLFTCTDSPHGYGNGWRAFDWLGFAGIPAAGAQIVGGSITYTLATSITGNNQILLDASSTRTTAYNIIAAINGTAGAGSIYSANLSQNPTLAALWAEQATQSTSAAAEMTQLQVIKLLSRAPGPSNQGVVTTVNDSNNKLSVSAAATTFSWYIQIGGLTGTSWPQLNTLSRSVVVEQVSANQTTVNGTVTYLSGGTGGTAGTRAVTFTNGGGTGAAGTITVGAGGVPTGSVTLTSAGTGYTSVPTQGTVATVTGTVTFSGGYLFTLYLAQPDYYEPGAMLKISPTGGNTCENFQTSGITGNAVTVTARAISGGSLATQGNDSGCVTTPGTFEAFDYGTDLTTSIAVSNVTNTPARRQGVWLATYNDPNSFTVALNSSGYAAYTGPVANIYRSNQLNSFEDIDQEVLKWWYKYDAGYPFSPVNFSLNKRTMAVPSAICASAQPSDLRKCKLAYALGFAVGPTGNVIGEANMTAAGISVAANGIGTITVAPGTPVSQLWGNGPTGQCNSSLGNVCDYDLYPGRLIWVDGLTTNAWNTYYMISDDPTGLNPTANAITFSPANCGTAANGWGTAYGSPPGSSACNVATFEIVAMQRANDGGALLPAGTYQGFTVASIASTGAGNVDTILTMSAPLNGSWIVAGSLTIAGVTTPSACTTLNNTFVVLAQTATTVTIALNSSSCITAGYTANSASVLPLFTIPPHAGIRYLISDQSVVGGTSVVDAFDIGLGYMTKDNLPPENQTGLHFRFAVDTPNCPGGLCCGRPSNASYQGNTMGDFLTIAPLNPGLPGSSASQSYYHPYLDFAQINPYGSTTTYYDSGGMPDTLVNQNGGELWNRDITRIGALEGLGSGVDNGYSLWAHSVATYFEPFSPQYCQGGLQAQIPAGSVFSLHDVQFYQPVSNPDEVIGGMTCQWVPLNSVEECTARTGKSLSGWSFASSFSTLADLKTAGFASGTAGGTITALNNASVGSLIWDSPTLASAPALFSFGLRATIPVGATSGTTDTTQIWVQPNQRYNPGYGAGDHVTVANVLGNLAANQTNAVISAVQDHQFFYHLTPQQYFEWNMGSPNSYNTLAVNAVGPNGNLTYVSGGTGGTPGTQVVTFTNGTGIGAAGTITVGAGGVPTGAVTMTAAGSGYITVPTQGTVATVSGTVTFSGGSLTGASSVDGVIAYASGGTGGTPGTQVVTFTNGNCNSPPLGTIVVNASGVPSGNVLYTTGTVGYQGAGCITVPNQGTVATVTGTVNFTGGALFALGSANGYMSGTGGNIRVTVYGCCNQAEPWTIQLGSSVIQTAGSLNSCPSHPCANNGYVVSAIINNDQFELAGTTYTTALTANSYWEPAGTPATNGLTSIAVSGSPAVCVANLTSDALNVYANMWFTVSNGPANLGNAGDAQQNFQTTSVTHTPPYTVTFPCPGVSASAYPGGAPVNTVSTDWGPTFHLGMEFWPAFELPGSNNGVYGCGTSTIVACTQSGHALTNSSGTMTSTENLKDFNSLTVPYSANIVQFLGPTMFGAICGGCTLTGH